MDIMKDVNKVSDAFSTPVYNIDNVNAFMRVLTHVEEYLSLTEIVSTRMALNENDKSLENAIMENNTNVDWKELLKLTSLFKKDDLVLYRVYKKGKIDKNTIVQDMCKQEWSKTFDQDKLKIPDKLLYVLWQHMFLEEYKSYKTQFVKESDTMSKSQMTKVEKDMKRIKKYLHSLTEYVILIYREVFIIDDRFVLKCFENDLDQILLDILQMQRFYKVSTTCDLQDLYILMACDNADLNMIAKLSKHIQVQHLEYAIKFGPFEFLQSLWKGRRSIPDFNIMIRHLSNKMTNKSWKEMKFFDMAKVI